MWNIDYEPIPEKLHVPNKGMFLKRTDKIGVNPTKTEILESPDFISDNWFEVNFFGYELIDELIAKYQYQFIYNDDLTLFMKLNNWYPTFNQRQFTSLDLIKHTGFMPHINKDIYPQMLETARNVRIHAWLAMCGCTFLSGRGRNQFYQSPFGDRYKSNHFCVTTGEFTKNGKDLWHSFDGSVNGIGHGGDIIELVKQVRYCTHNEAIIELNEFANGSSFQAYQAEANTKAVQAKKDASVILTSRTQQYPDAAKAYIESRGISPKIALLAGVEWVSYDLEYTDKVTGQPCIVKNKTGLGFPTSLSNKCWIIRHINGEKIKAMVAGAGYYTHLRNNKKDKSIRLFEGCFDFLSYLQLKYTDLVSKTTLRVIQENITDTDTKRKLLNDILKEVMNENFMILNSTNYLKMVLNSGVLNQYNTLRTYFDNNDTETAHGKAGDIALQLLGENMPNKTIIDVARYLYPDHNDLNDYLQSTLKSNVLAATIAA